MPPCGYSIDYFDGLYFYVIFRFPLLGV